jgi:hypothetical protein
MPAPPKNLAKGKREDVSWITGKLGIQHPQEFKLKPARQ